MSVWIYSLLPLLFPFFFLYLIADLALRTSRSSLSVCPAMMVQAYSYYPTFHVTSTICSNHGTRIKCLVHSKIGNVLCTQFRFTYSIDQRSRWPWYDRHCSWLSVNGDSALMILFRRCLSMVAVVIWAFLGKTEPKRFFKNQLIHWFYNILPSSNRSKCIANLLRESE